MTDDAAREAADLLRRLLGLLPPRAGQDVATRHRVEGAAHGLEVVARKAEEQGSAPHDD